MEKILSFINCDEEELARLRKIAGEHELIVSPAGRNRQSGPVDPEELADVTVILGNPPVEMLSRCKSLRFLQTRSAGVDNYLVPGVLPESVIVCSAVGSYGQSVSEHVFAMLLALMKHLPEYRDDQRAHIWQDLGDVRTLTDMRTYVVGTGDLGSHFASLVRGVGGHTVGFRRDKTKAAPGIDEMHSLDEFDEMLPEADVIALFMPSSGETRHFIDGRRLALMKPDAIIVNGGRGDAIDIEALTRHLEAGCLYGVGLDVTEPEPLPADHPLWDIDRVLITPHVAGYDHLEVTMRNIARITLDNLERYLQGEPLKNRMR